MLRTSHFFVYTVLSFNQDVFQLDSSSWSWRTPIHPCAGLPVCNPVWLYSFLSLLSD